MEMLKEKPKSNKHRKKPVKQTNAVPIEIEEISLGIKDERVQSNLGHTKEETLQPVVNQKAVKQTNAELIETQKMSLYAQDETAELNLRNVREKVVDPSIINSKEETAQPKILIPQLIKVPEKFKALNDSTKCIKDFEGLNIEDAAIISESQSGVLECNLDSSVYLALPKAISQSNEDIPKAVVHISDDNQWAEKKKCSEEEQSLKIMNMHNKLSIHDGLTKVAPDTVKCIKNIYPDVKSIQQCESMQNIRLSQTLVKVYTEEFLNRTILEANKSYTEFLGAVSQLEKYPLYDLVHLYKCARKSSIETRLRMKYVNSIIKRKKGSLWNSVKSEISSKGKCEDGCTVNISHSYVIKVLDNTKFDEVCGMLREFEESVISNSFYSYSDQLMKLRIEQYLHDIVNNMDASYSVSGLKNVSGGLPNLECLKKCISILFSYQRQPVKDKEFLEVSRHWLKILISMLLEDGSLSDHLFIVNHVMRCPNGIHTWASEFIQIPTAKMCSEVKGNLNCCCLYFTLLVLYLILNPAPDRNCFLKNLKASPSFDDCDGKFTVLDSEGEEEETLEVVRDWSDEDVLSLLNQIPLTQLYDHMLLTTTDGTSQVSIPLEDKILKLFAFSTALVNVIFTGLENHCTDDFNNSVEYMCNMIRHSVCYVSDHWVHYLDFNASMNSALQAEYDRYFFHTVYKIFTFQRLGVWKFLPLLPYKCVSQKMLWNILWLFHCSENNEDDIYLAKDVDVKLQDAFLQSALLEKVKTVTQQDQLYFLHAYRTLAVLSNSDEEFLRFLVHEIFQVSFVEATLQHLSKEGTIILSFMMKKYPQLLAYLLKEIEANGSDDVVNFAVRLFEETNIMEWVPQPEDIQIISNWLLSHHLSKPRNYLARKILTKMNWGFSSEGKLILPVEMHREVALLTLRAYMKFDSKGHEWMVSSGLAQMLQFAAVGSFNREDHSFVPWAWDLLFSLKLHVLDTKNPPWVHIYDGFIDVDNIPDLSQDVWLLPLQQAFQEKHPAACYLILVMSNIGHSVQKLMAEGLPCLIDLVGQQQYLAAIQSLYYTLPFFVKNSEPLLSHSRFIKAVSDLIIADMTVFSNITGCAVVGAVLHKIAAMIKHQIYQAWELTVECAAPLLKLWIKILMKVLSIQGSYNLKDSAKQVHFLLDVIVKLSFTHSYTRSNVLDLMHTFGNPLLSSNSNNEVSMWSKMFGSNNEVYIILNKQTLPEYPWLAYCILISETGQKHIKDIWHLVQKEMNGSSDIPPLAAIKKTANFLRITQPPVESLPIYRWALQALETPVSHPALPLIWQQFFLYFFERVHVSQSQMPKSNGMVYFKSGTCLSLLKKMKKRLQETEEFYRTCVHSSEMIPEGAQRNSSDFESIQKLLPEVSVLNLELLKIFRAFHVWLTSDNLHQSSVCLSALEPKYYCEKLKLILQNDQTVWFDLISMQQLKEEIDQKVHLWREKKNCIVSPNNSIQCEDESGADRISRHLRNYEVVKVLQSNITLDPPVQQTKDVVLSSWDLLVQVIERDQKVIFDKAKVFTELTSKLKQLNYNYENWVPQEFYVEDHEVTLSKPCHKGSGPKGCSGCAMFKLKVKKYGRNEKIQEKIDNNRMDYQIVQDQLVKLPVLELCCASVHIENYIRALSDKMKCAKGEEAVKLRRFGVTLFYYQIEAVDKIITSVAGYSPSRQFFSSSIESLGKEFIDGQEDQLEELAKSILRCPEAGVLASHLFNPNIASAAVFLDVYKILTSSVMQPVSNAALLVLLSKIDLHHWLKKKNVGFCERKKLFEEICNTLFLCGSKPIDEVLLVHEVFRKHFRITLTYMFPELYADAVRILLNGMETGTLCIEIWYEALQCFGCSMLNENSTGHEIENGLKKLAQNLKLPPDQQIFVSSQPLTIGQVKETLDLLYDRFMEKRKSKNLYQSYMLYTKPLGLFLSFLGYSLLCLNEDFEHRPALSIAELWKTIHQSFFPWLHPVVNKECLIFPWLDEHSSHAIFMFQMFGICLKYFHEQLLESNCEKSVLSYVWNFYVEAYVSHGLRHYSVFLCHSEFIKLPWHQFHPDTEDIKGMCTVLQNGSQETKEFLSKVSLRIPWKEVMQNISLTKSPEYVGKILGTLGRLLIISGWDISLTKSNFHQSNMKSLEDLPWHFLSLKETEGLLDLYYSMSDPLKLLQDDAHNSPDVYILQFLKLVCCMTVNSNTLDHSNSKRLFYVHKYINALSSCLSSKNGTILKRSKKFNLVLPSLLKDIEGIIVKDMEPGVKPNQERHNTLALVREAIGFLNSISDPELENIAVDSIVSCLKCSSQSPLVLPCLQSACRCLSSMTSLVTVVECCISSLFNTELRDPAEAYNIWHLVSSCFQVPFSMCDEFILVCVNKRAFLALYCYTVQRLAISTSSESKKLLLMNIIDWIKRSEISEKEEAKILLLWDKALEISVMLALEDEFQVIQRVLSTFCSDLSMLAEDKSSIGLLAAVGFGRPSQLSVNFRFLCRVVSAFVLLQIPDNASLRLESMAPGYLPITDGGSTFKISMKSSEPVPSITALKALENLKMLQKNKPYSALQSLVTSAVKYVMDPRHCLSESRQLLKEFALNVYPKEWYLYSLG